MNKQKVLITGATGYIGRRLVKSLLEENNYDLKLFVRNAKKIEPTIADQVEIAEGDTFNEGSLDKALKGVDTAFYLVHSMGKGDKFVALDRLSAMNFREACIRAGVKKIVYLGGLGSKDSASKHLSSRIETGEILLEKPDKINTIWFRAGVIIGSGSASFEIIRHLMQKLPVLVTPIWVKTKTQCISVNDVISYLTNSLEKDVKGNLVVDIGSEEITFKNVLLKAAEGMGLKRTIVEVPILTPKLSSYWLVFVTSVPFSIASALIEGLKSETLKQNDNAEKYFPEITPASYEQAVENALNEIEHNQVISSWCDSTGGEICDVPHVEETAKAIFKETHLLEGGRAAAPYLFRSICMLGGDAGYFNYGFLWSIRGILDKFVGGAGLTRGRRDCYELRIGDSLDFWKVVDVVPNKRLLLLAEMKVPGKAWLEFDIQDDTIVQTAYFYPKGLLGRIYWYAMKPFHYFVFKDLITNLVKRANEIHDTSKVKD